MHPIRFNARDGYSIGGTLYRPARPHGAAVVIHAAAGVRQEYYAKFAASLAEHGHTTLTFDYRGIGASRPVALRGFNARMLEWATLDAAGALDCLQREAPDARIAVVGHSFGGQCLGLVPGNERYAAGLLIATQSGYWRHWTGSGRAGMWLLTHAALPGISNLLGYFPSRRFGQGEDLPAGVASEWARWCRHPDYLVGALGASEGYSKMRVPLRLVWIADDRYAPLAAARAAMQFYPSAKVQFHEIRPEEAGAAQIGHFGFFRERFRATLWKDAVHWLAENT